MCVHDQAVEVGKLHNQPLYNLRPILVSDGLGRAERLLAQILSVLCSFMRRAQGRFFLQILPQRDAPCFGRRDPLSSHGVY